MTRSAFTIPGDRRRALTLVSFLLLQSVAAVFFVGDVLADIAAEPPGAHTVLEALVAAALVCGVVLSMLQLRADHDLMEGQERTIRTARGELARSIRQQFAQWHLTPAEQDVGFLALKGLDVAEIADLRGSAPGTVRAQLTRIYAKAGVSGRAQFAAWFVEDLLDGGLAPETAPEVPEGRTSGRGA